MFIRDQHLPRWVFTLVIRIGALIQIDDARVNHKARFKYQFDK